MLKGRPAAYWGSVFGHVWLGLCIPAFEVLQSRRQLQWLERVLELTMKLVVIVTYDHLG